jgi:hypothetical protein
MVDCRSETMVVSGDDGSFHVEELYEKYVIEFTDPGASWDIARRLVKSFSD